MRKRSRIYRVTLDSFHLFEDLLFADSRPPPKPDHDPPGQLALLPGERAFSWIEEQVIRLLSREAPLSRPAIAEKLRLSKLGMIRGLLSNLVEREVLELTKRGYVLGRARRDQATPPQAN